MSIKVNSSRVVRVNSSIKTKSSERKREQIRHIPGQHPIGNPKDPTSAGWTQERANFSSEGLNKLREAGEKWRSEQPSNPPTEHN